MRVAFSLIIFCFVCVEYSFSTENQNNYILCSSRCSSLTVSFADPLTLPSDCQETEGDNTGVSDGASICYVRYNVNYQTQQIQIEFQALNDTDKFQVQPLTHFFLQKLSISLTHPADETTREYFCNTKNDCARDFYLTTIEHLIRDGQQKIDLIKTKLYNSTLLMDDRSRRRCIDSTKVGNKISTLCRVGLCYAHYRPPESSEKNESKVQSCLHNAQPTLLSELEYHVSPEGSHAKELLEYHCNKNICNRNDMIQIIKGIVHEYTHWKLTQDDLNRAQTKQASSSTRPSYLSGAFLVQIYILIQLLF